MVKPCIKCGEDKKLVEFYPHKGMSDGRLNMCKICSKRESNERYHGPDKLKILRQMAEQRFKKEHSEITYPLVMYERMKRRTLWTINRKGRKLLITPEDFLALIEKSDFKRMFKRYKESGYKKSFAPSVDRIDNNGHYTLSNIQIITLSDNVKKARLIDYKRL